MQQSPQQELSIRQRQSTFIQFAKSRDQLMEEERQYFTQQEITRRRTKIVATLGPKTTSLDMMRKLVQAGANSFLINMAYQQSNMKQISAYRKQLEDEFHTKLPLTTVLKGTLTRIGDLTQPMISLKKGQTYRIITKKQIIGDNCICSVDDENLHKKVKIGDKLLVDYGQVSFSVDSIENSDKTLETLREECEYDDDFQKPRDIKIISQLPHVYNNQEDDETEGSYGVLNESSNLNEGQQQNQQQPQQPQQEQQEQEQLNNYQSKYINNQKNKKMKIYKVLVCTVDSDCTIKSFKPIFIYTNQTQEETIEKRKQNYQSAKQLHKKSLDEQDIKEQQENDEDSSSDSQSEEILSPKDINDIDSCVQNDIDCICISNVKTADDVKQVRQTMGVNTSTKVIVKIQNRQAVDNIEKIIKLADGIILARSYLVIHYPVEKLFMLFKKIIQQCHSIMKPIQVSCNILESMVSTLLPTTTEVGEIANLVEQFVDGIILSQETTVGEYPIEAVQTLSRTCIECEKEQIKKMMDNPQSRTPVSIQSSSKSQSTILNTIIFCVIEAVYRLQARLVISFSQSGSTIVKMSKLRIPCPILAVIPNVQLSRNISFLAGVQGRFYNIKKNKQDFENALPIIIENAKKQNLVRKGDFVVITMFENERKGSTNQIKIQIVE